MQSRSIIVEGELTFATVVRLIKEHEHYFEKDHEILVFDLHAIEHSDSAGLALLVNWFRRAKRADKTLRFINPPKQMLAMAHVCGLLELLPFEEVKN